MKGVLTRYEREALQRAIDYNDYLEERTSSMKRVEEHPMQESISLIKCLLSNQTDRKEIRRLMSLLRNAERIERKYQAAE